MTEKEFSLGRVFVQEAVKAATWGLIFLVVMGMFITSIKQDIKEGIAFGVDRFARQVFILATHPALEARTKALVKKGIDYTAKRASEEARALLEAVPGDPGEKKQNKEKGSKAGKVKL
jgi:hypothetical protein